MAQPLDSAVKVKRTAQVKSHVLPEMREQLELFAAQEGRVISMSDYLFGVIEEHIAFRQAMRLSKQKLGRRVSNS